MDPTFIDTLKTVDDLVPLPENQFTQFEDLFVERSLPFYVEQSTELQDLCLNQWNNRERLTSAFKGSNFFGQLVEPRVRLLKNPLSAFEASPLKYGNTTMRLGVDPANVAGITLQARIHSSRADIRGEITRDIWYVRARIDSTRYRNHKFWTRIVGPNIGENTIDSGTKRSKRESGGSTVSTNGRTTGHRRVSNK